LTLHNIFPLFFLDIVFLVLFKIKIFLLYIFLLLTFTKIVFVFLKLRRRQIQKEVGFGLKDVEN
jgi:hypothetical protein